MKSNVQCLYISHFFFEPCSVILNEFILDTMKSIIQLIEFLWKLKYTKKYKASTRTTTTSNSDKYLANKFQLKQHKCIDVDDNELKGKLVVDSKNTQQPESANIWQQSLYIANIYLFDRIICALPANQQHRLCRSYDYKDH
jgi:hypothetical protein